jgi:uncharacterized membrane protein
MTNDMKDITPVIGRTPVTASTAQDLSGFGDCCKLSTLTAETRGPTSSGENNMTLTSKNARVAGLLYLLLTIAAPIRLIFIPKALFVSGNAAATANNIAAHEPLFRFGIAGDLFCGTILIFLVLALYRLFKSVNQDHAVMMVILGGVLPAAI